MTAPPLRQKGILPLFVVMEGEWCSVRFSASEKQLLPLWRPIPAACLLLTNGSVVYLWKMWTRSKQSNDGSSAFQERRAAVCAVTNTCGGKNPRSTGSHPAEGLACPPLPSCFGLKLRNGRLLQLTTEMEQKGARDDPRWKGAEAAIV